MMAEKVKRKLKSIIEDLNSGDERKIAVSLKELEVHGDASAIRPVMELLRSGTLSERNRAAVIELLSSLKDSSTTVEIMDVLQSDEFAPLKQEILSVIWNMKVDFSDYIDDFVEMAVEGTFMDALECLTIIENLEGPFMEENILECQLHLKNYLEDTAPKDPQKAHILSEIAIVIKDINEQLMD